MPMDAECYGTSTTFLDGFVKPPVPVAAVHRVAREAGAEVDVPLAVTNTAMVPVPVVYATVKSPTF